MIHTYKNILVAVDGSKESQWAFQKAIEISKRNNASITLAHVIDIRSYGSMEAYDATITEQAGVHAKELLNKYAQSAEQQDVSEVKTILEFGSPKHKIAKDISPDKNIDLIICGATGMNAVERILLGSVSENIVRHASCDVLVVRTEK
jgi:nucleotide-binding universal stress UspA family protein